MHALVDFFWTNGVGQNLTASAILFVGGYLLGRSHFKKIRETHRMIAELHAKHGPAKDPGTPPSLPARRRRADIRDLPIVITRRYRDR